MQFDLTMNIFFTDLRMTLDLVHCFCEIKDHNTHTHIYIYVNCRTASSFTSIQYAVHTVFCF